MNQQLNVLVLEDEQRAGEKLTDLISEIQPQAKVEWKRSVKEGLKFLKTKNPVQLIFSDIELIDGNAFKIFDSITPNCPIIFCTAYDKFYVNAFQTNGIAYLLKPYTKEQFVEAWKKYELLFESKKEQPVSLSADVLSDLQKLINRDATKYKNTFSVKKKDGVFLLNVESIAYFQAQGDFVIAVDQKQSKHILNYPLKRIEELVDPQYFFRINRSEIINLKSILSFNVYNKNRLAIHLHHMDTVLFTANNRTPRFRVWIEEQ